MVLKSLPNAEDILTDILNKSIEVTKLICGKEEFEVSMKVLCCKIRKRMAVANILYSYYRHNKSLLLHFLLKMLIRVEWKEFKQLVCYRSTVYLFYLLILILFIT
jgi:hypothetical protein